MNKAQSIRMHIPADKRVTARHPVSLLFTEGTVTGTWEENRINHKDFGFYIRFDYESEARQIPHRFIEI